MLQCSSSSGSSRVRTSGNGCSRRFIVEIREHPQFSGLLFRQRVAEEITTSNLRTRQILHQVRLPQWRVKLDVEMECAVIGPIGWSLMEDHDIGKRHAPQIVI